MAAPSRRQRRSVEDELFDAAHRFDFFQAVALLELMRPEATPVGEATDARAEPVAFEGNFGFGFQASDIQAIIPPRADGRRRQPKLRTGVLGLGGVNGPLPNAISEMVLERTKSRDTGFRAFLDIFNHRLLSLFYRLRRWSRIDLGHDPPERSVYSRYLRALMGLGTPHLANRLDIADRSLYAHAGLLAGRARSAHGLETILKYHFRSALRIKPLSGAWCTLDETQVTRVGRANHALGQNVVVGSRVWDQQSGFTIEIDFTDITIFQDFLPVGLSYKRMMGLVRFYVGGEYEIYLRLRYLAPDVPARGLSTTRGMMLGWTSWLGTRTKEQRVVTIKTHNGAQVAA
jgi:type VI secretion system protein ImpH